MDTTIKNARLLITIKQKEIMNYLLFILALTFAGLTYAQETTAGKATIQTSAECGSCKTRLEETLNYTKGVKFAELNMTDKTLNVQFNPKKISLKEIKKIISETGYDADEVKANPKSVNELPACCKPGGMK